MMPHVCISGVGHYLPSMVRTNHDLARFVDTTDEWIESKTGIRQRHIADPAEATSDLALQAARQALEAAGRKPEEVDLIVLATSSPDMLLPSTAAILQGKLGASRAVAFDIGAVCAGFVYALVTATGLMRAFPCYRTALVVGAETYSRLLNWRDRTTCVFFGDGAGAVVLTASEESGYLGHYLMNDGAGWEVIQCPGGGSRSQACIERGLHEFRMDGRRVWDFAIRAMPEAVRGAVEEAGCTVEDLNLVVPHQANRNIIEHGMQALGLDMSRACLTIEHTANTAAASIPIALSLACAEGRLTAGDRVAFVGFGGGLSWGAAIFRWVVGGAAR